MCRKKAFTLVELLVVISIIAMLLSILMPSLGRARDMAKEIVGLAHQASFHTGLSLYAEDFNGYLPLASEPVSYVDEPLGGWWYSSISNPDTPISWYGNGYQRFWQQTAAGYLGEQWDIFKCPASKCVGPHDTGTKDARYAGHYGTSVGIMAKGKLNEDVPHKKVVNFKSLSGKAMIFDSGAYTITRDSARCPTGFFHYMPGYRKNENGSANGWAFESDFGTQGYDRDIYKGRHPGRTINITWLDGHGSNMNVDDFVDKDSHWVKETR
ncbi:MAG: type II secretion system GspH family protein [Anaerohalosphaeraceae bacterium]|nr:type II secretion system GspH family protein [Anaerohalosphaeraceae bacterium]